MGRTLYSKLTIDNKSMNTKLQKKVMNNRIITSLMCVLLFEGTFVIVYANTPMHDFQNEVHLIKMLSNSQDQLSEMGAVHGSITKLNTILGYQGNYSLASGNNFQIPNFLYKYSTMSKSSTGLFDIIMNDVNSINIQKDMSWNRQQINHILFPDNSTTEVSFNEIDRIENNRDVILVESTKSSLALAETRQASVDETNDIIYQLSKSSCSSDNIHEDLVNSNQLLSIIADELVKLRQLSSKQLELFSILTLKMTSKVAGKSFPDSQPKKNNMGMG